MSLVTHKYTPSEMSDQELEATFAARQNTVDFLLKALRDQIHRGTLSSYVITGPRGAGKSTIIQMLDLRIRKDPELSAAWQPVVFPEEQFNMISLRDMLAGTLQILARNGVEGAQEWLEKVEGEPDEEQSEQFAVTGLREITRRTGKRLVLFIENLNQLLEDHLNEQTKSTLRRLLMTDAFMMVIGSTVHVFESLRSYDEAFFNYFGQVPLGRLDAGQVSELLRKRAEFDQNERFLRDLPKQQAKIKTLVHLTGGNPRFVLMLYELLSLQQVTTIVQYLKRLVDELTPLLKDEMENLPAQQRKIVHAIMEKGGTAQPKDIATATRLPLNAVTIQLKRLKDAQILEVLGGGKGRAANYTVPDKLFSIWYQMRYLSQNRRRIELFVDMLRIWYETDERIETLRKLAFSPRRDDSQALRECATTAEYFAASLKGTKYEESATKLCVSHWIQADIREAAMAFADLSSSKPPIDEFSAQLKLSNWLSDQGDLTHAVSVLDEVISKPIGNLRNLAAALIFRGHAKRSAGSTRDAIIDFDSAIGLDAAPKLLVYWAFVSRGSAKGELGDSQAALSDFTAAIAIEGVADDARTCALIGRSYAKADLNDFTGAITDCTTIIEANSAPTDQIVKALFQRSSAKEKLGDFYGALSDCSAVVERAEATREQTIDGLKNRACIKFKMGEALEAAADFTRIIEFKGATPEQVAFALLGRAAVKLDLKDINGQLADCETIIQLNGADRENVAWALIVRSTIRMESGDLNGAMDDCNKVIAFSDIGEREKSIARAHRADVKCSLDDCEGASADWGMVIASDKAPKELKAKSLFNRGLFFSNQNESSRALDDFLLVIKLGIVSDDLVPNAAALAILNRPDEFERVIGEFQKALDSASLEEGSRMATSFLKFLAEPQTKDVWLSAWKSLANNSKPQLAEAIRVFEPICHILDGQDRTLLDALPPEQREFAIEVLAEFEGDTDGEGEKTLGKNPKNALEKTPLKY